MVFYSDVDDTLMLDGEMSNELRAFLNKFDFENHDFIPCSGRPTHNLIYLFKEFGVRYVIGFNGGEIYDMQNNMQVFESSIDQEYVKKITKSLNEENCNYVLYNKETLLTDNIKNEYALTESRLTKQNIIEDKKIINSIKILGLKEPNKINNVIEKMKLEFNDLEISKSKPFFIEITNKGINKWSSIQRLNKIIGNKDEDTYVFGDSNNDLSMFESNAKKIAVANANEQILSKADEICKSCKDHGVVEYITKLLKG